MKIPCLKEVLLSLFVCGLTRPTDAAIFSLGFADEFLTGMVSCSTYNNSCHTISYWGGRYWVQSNVYDASNPPTWTFLGAQNGNAGGRANAKSKVMMKFRDMDITGSRTMTVTLTRRRVLPTLPSEGDACNATFGTAAGFSSQTLDTMGSPPEDTRINNRMLPVLDFSLETATNGVELAYNENIATNTGGGMGSNANANGCFKIKWW